MERFHYPASNDDFDDACDLDALLHPFQAFEHPSEVVNDSDLTLNEKRAILASWASDACAIEAVPTLRCLPGGRRPVHFDEVMDALRALDEEARRTRRTAGNHRVARKSSITVVPIGPRILDQPVRERLEDEKRQGVNTGTAISPARGR